MQAIVARRYGPPDVLQLSEVEQPAVGDNDVLVRVRAASLNPADWHLMRGEPYLIRLLAGLRKPRKPIQGLDAAGTVERVGRNVKRFQPGDEVFGETGQSLAEYVSVPEKSLGKKPSTVTFEQAAAVPVAGLTALQGLRDHVSLQAGESVLINGASGGVGTFAVQIAKSMGARVTGVCSTRNLELVRSLGADVVIDYTAGDFTAGRDRYDVICDTVGNRSLRDLRRVLKPRARCVVIGAAGMGNWVSPLVGVATVGLASLVWSQKLTTMLARSTPEDLQALHDLMESGAVKPVIDRTYPLPETAAAMAYLEAGHARGKVVVTI